VRQGYAPSAKLVVSTRCCRLAKPEADVETERSRRSSCNKGHETRIREAAGTALAASSAVDHFDSRFNFHFNEHPKDASGYAGFDKKSYMPAGRHCELSSENALAR
jgi:hypothetical protein